MADLPRVAVIGAGGAIGGFFAAHLLAADTAEVTLCVRTPFRELVVERPPAEDGSVEALRSTPVVLAEPSAVEGVPFDWVLLATKANQVDGAAAWLRAAVGERTTVVVLQNGVEHEQRVRPHVPAAATVLPAVVYCGAEAVAPGRIVHRTNGFAIVADDDPGQRLAALYAPSRAGIRLTDDLTSALWQKLCANVVANGITALTGRRMPVMRDPEVAWVGGALVEECLAVARAEGAVVPADYGASLLAGVRLMPDDAGTSMLYDRLAGRPLEWDAKYGAVVRAAERNGIAVPLHRTFAALLAASG
jgi:2-dehydropantoate 2-reductase